MAYTIDSSVLPIEYSADALTIILNDEIDYSVTPIRSTVRVFVHVDKMKSDNTIKQSPTVASDTGSATTAASWSWSNVEDGWYRILFTIVKVAYSSGSTYAKYDAVYDGNNKVYRSKQSANTGNDLTDIAWWEEIDNPASLALNKDTAEESENIESLVYNRILIPLSKQGYGDFIAKESANCCGDCDTDYPTYELLNLLINGAIVADTRSQVISGEKISRRLESILERC